MKTEMQAIIALMRDRRSTWPKDFNPNIKIEDKIIVDILENAVWAPNHGLNQPWHFKVFHGIGVKTFFTRIKEIYLEITPAEKVSDKKLSKYDDRANRVSHVLAVCMKRDPVKRYPETEDIVATACVVQNIYLQLKPFGIAGYLSTGDVCYTQQVKNFLGLAEDDRCIGFFQLGIPSPEINLPQRKRISAAEKTEWAGE